MTLAAIQEKLRVAPARPDIVYYVTVWNGAMERAGTAPHLGNWNGDLVSHHGPSPIVHAAAFASRRNDPDLGEI